MTVQRLDDAYIKTLERADIEGADVIRFLYADHGGIIRGKASSRGRLAERLRTGIGHTVGMMAMSMLDSLQPVAGMGPVGEVRIVPDPATFTMLPYAPGAAAMCADLVRLDGDPWEACARSFLKQAIAELAGDGYELAAAFEPEFTLGRRVPDPAGGPDRLVPIDDSLCYSSTGFHLAHDYTMALLRAFEAQGLRVEHYYPEYGHGQQEVSIRHASALRAADNHVFFRETVRGVAFRQNLWASLAPKPIPDQIGNGCHLHISLWSAGMTRNLFYDAAGKYGLSDVGYHFIGGLLAHLPALLALTAATVNSYRRLSPRSWSSAFACYGMDNREAAVRICSPLRGDAEGSANLEFKPSDSSANPYLALGAVIFAGLDGVRAKADPGEAVNVDPADLSDGERARLGVRPLPHSLGEALDALAADELLMDALGPLRRTAYLAVKRSDIDAFGQHDAAFECFHHFTKI
ncbi:MAG TPA: glutamine synthetase family protein [Streptosporangiaceae bacterium]|jgi:glutamine synthetase|nr:glutamine synthetase family protein [Streptosporangiaceae bacterium]